MAKNTASATTSATQIRDQIFKKKWLARGMTEKEYERSQLLNELFHLAVAQGCPEADIATEFRNSTGEGLIEKYGRLLPPDSPYKDRVLSLVPLPCETKPSP